jgi:replicative DNA helicase
MTPETTILKHVLTYDNWLVSKDYISLDWFPKEVVPVYSAINNYHLVHPNTNLSSSDLTNLVFAGSIKDKDYISLVIDNINKCDASEVTTAHLLNALRKKHLLKKLSLSSYEVSEGRNSSNSVDELIQELATFDTEVLDDASNDEFVSSDLEYLVNSAIQTPGLRWRLGTLNKMLGSIRKGDFGFIFARPETGKTTFLASEVTFMAGQLKEEDGPILWINNEEQGNKVMLRCYQAGLGLDLTKLYQNIPKHKEAFHKLTKEKIKLFDSSAINRRQVESLCEKHKPSLLIFDQLDKIVGFENDREDLKLGAIYQWARELAKKYCPVIAVCQADGSGEGVRWLTMSNVANAKTAKQAEADWILGIGKVNDAGYDNIRYLHLSKNKLMGDADSDPEQRHGRREVIIEPLIGRYRDI